LRHPPLGSARRGDNPGHSSCQPLSPCNKLRLCPSTCARASFNIHIEQRRFLFLCQAKQMATCSSKNQPAIAQLVEHLPADICSRSLVRFRAPLFCLGMFEHITICDMVMARWHAWARLLGNGHDVLFDFIFDWVRVWPIWIESRIAGCVWGGQDDCVGCTDIGRAPDVRAWLDEVEPSRTAEGPPPAVREETSAQTNKQTLPTIRKHKETRNQPLKQTSAQAHTNKCTRTRTRTHTQTHTHMHT